MRVLLRTGLGLAGAPELRCLQVSRSRERVRWAPKPAAARPRSVVRTARFRYVWEVLIGLRRPLLRVLVRLHYELSSQFSFALIPCTSLWLRPLVCVGTVGGIANRVTGTVGSPSSGANTAIAAVVRCVCRTSGGPSAPRSAAPPSHQLEGSKRASSEGDPGGGSCPGGCGGDASVCGQGSNSER